MLILLMDFWFEKKNALTYVKEIGGTKQIKLKH